MLRVTQNSNAEAATKYHDNNLAHSDYYSRDDKVIGMWGGRAAIALGLSGEVQKKDFHALCHNINPQDNKQLTARHDANRTVGYDFTFDVPKSVSIVFSQTCDPDITAALNAAIQSTMAEIERNAEARVRKGGKAENRITGNLVFAAFTHEETRPINGGSPDPHLHQHVFTFNATYDPVEAKFKAAQFHNIKADAPYYEALYHNKLAYELQKVGYALRRSAHNFEIAGFTRATIDKFSNRTLEINQKAEELGITRAEDKAKLGAKTRANKRTGDKEAMKKEWTSRLTPDELRLIHSAKNKSRTVENTGQGDAARRNVDHALEHGLERKSVIGHNELMISALKHSMGSASREELEAEIKNRRDLLSGEIGKKLVYTNTAALDEEKRLIEAARAGRGRFKPISPDYVPANKELNEEQAAAVKHALESKDLITIITGGAGTGKTWTVKEIAAAVATKGIGFHAFAPSSAASRDVQQGEGFTNATTLAALLQDKKMQEQLKDGMLWVDEAGLVGCQTLSEVIAIAQKQKARLLLTGDIRQHTAVERGDALRILQKFGGIQPAYITKIQRQKTDNYREAVTLLSEGKIEKGFRKLDRIGAIKESPSFDKAVEALAAEYVAARKSRESVLVVAPTHKQGQVLNQAIREGLKKEGKLAKKDQLFDIQINLALTEAQKKDSATYEAGQAIQFHQNLNSIQRGERYNVLGRDEYGNVLIENTGQRKVLPLHEAKKFSVYKLEQIGLAKGDIIRISQNGFSLDKKRLNNGNNLLVKGFDEQGNILALTSGRNEIILDKNYRNLAHGYYSTSIAAQGKSVNRVLILQTAQTGKAASKEQFYVSASRGKFAISVFTDNKEHLLESVQRSSARMAAIELAPFYATHRITALKEKIKNMSEAARTHITDAKEALKSRIHSDTRTQEIKKDAPGRSR